MIVLGVDPGTRSTGYAVVEAEGGKVSALAAGCLELHKFGEHAARLQKIWSKVEGLIREFSPAALAVEAPFYGKNPQATLKLGRAQGVAMAAAMHLDVEVFEYAPREVKRAVTGNGAASKEQVARMVLTHFAERGLNPEGLGDDAFDALAVALTHAYRVHSGGNPTHKSPSASKKSGGWNAFVQQNPDRIKT